MTTYNESLSELYGNIAVLAYLGDIKTATKAMDVYESHINPNSRKKDGEEDDTNRGSGRKS